MKRISILSFILGVVLTAGACSIHAQSAPQSKAAGLGVSLTIVRDDAPTAASTAPTPANIRQKALKKATTKPASNNGFSVDAEDNGGWKATGPNTETKTVNGTTFYRGEAQGTSNSDAHAGETSTHASNTGINDTVTSYTPSAVDYNVKRQVKGVKLMSTATGASSASYPHNFTAHDENSRCAGEGLEGVSAYCGPMSEKTQQMVDAIGKTAYHSMLDGKKHLSAAERDLVFRMMQRQYLASYAEEHHYIFRLTVKDSGGAPMLVATYTNIDDCIDLGNAAVQSKAFQNFACQKVEI